MNLDQHTIAVIGLGYVGLPLAVEFGKQRPVIGFDISASRIEALQAGQDHTRECSTEELREAHHLRYSSQPEALRAAQVFIVTVPTPVDKANRPDMGPLIRACATVGQALKAGDVVIFESTVYPGATEEVCVPALEKASGLRFNHDFFCGYSPERINPGDKLHRLPAIKKVTSGSTPAVAEAVDGLYRQIVTAGTHLTSSIRVAEAAKVIENTQRDVNIALMNELSLIFHRLGIDTLEVLQAAGTKWNFLPFRPGLVGGHCIGVDPYYLTHKAQEVGYHPDVILAGRRINDSMAAYVADETVKLMLRKGLPVLGSRILVLGLAFKENCPDVRNTKVVDIVRTLQGYNASVDVYDPWIHIDDARHEYGLECLPAEPAPGRYAAIILAVGHHQFVSMGTEVRRFGQANAVLFDVKGLLPLGAAEGRL
ncbi:nucleotide sugar dehydrogenase [Hydrogenophaga sp. OTU3427]|uniref:nucleotide sugar dehydrogenase n=1 Tax=Hydrogenophaga sp. OTU3427 TaxID=3043856 RepID=UPI00313C4980